MILGNIILFSLFTAILLRNFEGDEEEDNEEEEDESSKSMMESFFNKFGAKKKKQKSDQEKPANAPDPDSTAANVP